MSAYNTRDCNICSDRNCAGRPRLGKPVIFNCPKFNAKRNAETYQCKIDSDNPTDEELEAIGAYAFGWLPRLLSKR